MEVGCYSMDLYCDVEVDGIHEYREFPHVYGGQTRGGCVKEARKDGWVFRRDRKVICPKCKKAGRKPRDDKNEG